MKNEIGKSKAALRQEIRARLKAMTPKERADASAQACALLQAQASWQDATSVLLYAPLHEELDVWPLVELALAAGKTVALPRFVAEDNAYICCAVGSEADDLKHGQFGIREPADHCAELPLNRLDLMLVPGVAFSLQGRRLGRGKGYYDQLLATARGTTCGVAFDQQIVNDLPVEPHDVQLNCILTPTRWVEP